MKKINVLPKEVFNRISAGEVVERPASVVKELFENAVDAGAHDITVMIENGGIDEIYIQDDGHGIAKEELHKVFLPHATSKIERVEDLELISTLGFRGEALASIGSVASVKLTSRTQDSDECMQIRCEGGVTSEVYETRGIQGTAVTVSNLFYNTPARLKFLKTPKGEEKEVTSLMEKLIIAHPFVAVKYYADNRLIFQTYGEGLKEALLAIYGKEAVDNCYNVIGEKNGVSIMGYFGNINYYKGNRTYQTIIVNDRYVTDATVSSAIQNAYSSYLMKRQYPFYVVCITLDPRIVDVNVHPRKSEVRFANNQVVYSAIYSMISKVLDGTSQSLNLVVSAPFLEEQPINPEDCAIQKYEVNGETRYYIDPSKEPKSENYLHLHLADKIKASAPDESKYVGEYVYEKPAYRQSRVSDFEKKLKQVVDLTEETPDKSHAADDIFKANQEYIRQLEAEKAAYTQAEMPTDTPVRYIGQALSTYLLVESANQLIVIDQHAAHERILFDNFYHAVKTGKVDKQSLLIPYTFSANAREAEMLFELTDIFKEVGIDLEVLHDNVYRVYGVPIELCDMDLTAFFKDILTDSSFRDEKIPTLIKERIAQKACKSAIKAGDTLSNEEVNALLELLKQNWELKCPHGRPIAIKISRTEMDKWFKRIV